MLYIVNLLTFQDCNVDSSDFLYIITILLAVITVFMVKDSGVLLANYGNSVKFFILNILLNAKLNDLVLLIILRIIKLPIYSLLAFFLSNSVLIFCLYIFIGTIITYCFSKFIWDPYWKNSPAFKFLDIYVLDHVIGMVLFFVPILHIFYFTPGFVLMNVSYSSKMRLAS